MFGAIILILFAVILLILLYNLYRDLLNSDRLDVASCHNKNRLLSRIKDNRRNRIRMIVTESSKWYQQVLDLNSNTKWNCDIFDNGHSECYLFVDSKAQFDRAQPHGRVEEFLIENRERIILDRELIRSNWDIRKKYDEMFLSLSSSATEVFCRSLGVLYDDYIGIEKELVEASKLSIIDSYGITCRIVYTSPHGRNRYEKKYYYDDFDIDEIYERIDRRNEEQSTEQHRRRVERSKMTASLRYDVMNRDGFRCCLCGRSSADGVELEVDHIIPISKGGETSYTNLQTLCRDCNRGKGAKY